MKRRALFFLLISLLLASSVTIVEAIYTDSEGEFENGSDSLYGDYIVSYIWEGYAEEDLNNDGDEDDSIIRYYKISTGTTKDIGIGTDPAIHGNIIAFVTSEWDIELDLNNDGDTNDGIIRYYNIITDTITNTESDGSDPDVYGDIIAFTVSEYVTDTDINSDGDKNDQFIAYHKISTSTTTMTNTEGSYTSIYENTIALETVEKWYGTDLTGDGDTEDYVIRYYDIPTDTTTNTGEIGSDPCIDGNWISFYTGENWVDEDLNGDGVITDWVVQYYEISTGTTTSIGIAGRDASLAGGVIAFQTSEYDIYEDLNSDGDEDDTIIRYYAIPSKNTALAEEGEYPSINGKTIAYIIWESSHGSDLNGDGDTEDPIVGYYVIPPEFVIPEFPFGTIGAMMAGISAIALKLHKRKK